MLKTLVLQKKISLLAALAFASPLSHAMIIEMRELYNPHLGPTKKGQTLILMGNCPGAPNPVSNTQNSVIMSVIAQHNSALITEELTTSSNSPLSQLQTAAQQGITPFHFGRYFAQTCDQNYNQLEIIHRYARELHQKSDEETIKKGFKQGFDTLLEQTYDELSTIEKAINNHTSYTSLAHSIVDEHAIINDDNTIDLNAQSLWSMTERVTNSLFEATLLKSIHEQRDKRLLFVLAGATHTQRLAPILVKAGYQEGTVISHQKEFEIYTQTASDIMNDAKSLSDKSAQYAVDAARFFALCKTLPEQTN